MFDRGTLTTLSTITCDAAFRPVRSPGGTLTRNSGASTHSEVTGVVVHHWFDELTARVPTAPRQD